MPMSGPVPAPTPNVSARSVLFGRGFRVQGLGAHAWPRFAPCLHCDAGRVAKDHTRVHVHTMRRERESPQPVKSSRLKVLSNDAGHNAGYAQASCDWVKRPSRRRRRACRRRRRACGVVDNGVYEAHRLKNCGDENPHEQTRAQSRFVPKQLHLSDQNFCSAHQECPQPAFKDSC